MGKTAFGEHLKREREMRGVSLEEISAATRISTRFLTALENEDWPRLPGGIFNRGFVRSVARFLGLDEESMVAEYALATGDHGTSATSSVTRPVPAAPDHTRWISAVVVLAVLGVLVLGGWTGWRKFSAWRAARHARTSAATQTVPPVTTAADQPAGATPAVTAPPAGTTESSAAPAASSALLELKVDAGKPTTVRIVADGKTIFNGRMEAGESQTFQAAEQFDVSARDSSAVLLELNGQTVAPLGPPGQPGKLTLTRKDLKKNPGGPD